MCVCEFSAWCRKLATRDAPEFKSLLGFDWLGDFRGNILPLCFIVLISIMGMKPQDSRVGKKTKEVIHIKRPPCLTSSKSPTKVTALILFI